MITGTAQPESRGAWRRWRRASAIARLAGALLMLALASLLLLVIVAAALPLFGYRSTVIYGGSMEPAVGRGALVVTRMVDPQTLEVGDIITFRRPEAKVSITHRIVGLREDQGERLFTVKGDANASPDPNEITFERPVGKVVLTVPYAGYLIGIARSPQGILLLLVLPVIGLAALHVLESKKGGG